MLLVRGGGALLDDDAGIQAGQFQESTWVGYDETEATYVARNEFAYTMRTEGSAFNKTRKQRRPIRTLADAEMQAEENEVSGHGHPLGESITIDQLICTSVDDRCPEKGLTQMKDATVQTLAIFSILKDARLELITATYEVNSPFSMVYNMIMSMIWSILRRKM